MDELKPRAFPCQRAYIVEFTSYEHNVNIRKNDVFLKLKYQVYG